MKYYWVLGATGYVGAALSERLVKLSYEQQDVVVTTLAHNKLPFKALERTNLLTGSLEQFDFAWLERFPPEVIFHCARIGGRNDAERRRASARGRSANERWYNALAALPKPPVVVYCSGSLMYGNASDGVLLTEQQPLNPTAYARHYIEAERPWLDNPLSLDVRMARPDWIAGPDSWLYHFFYLPAIKRGKVPYYGDGEQRMSLLHLDDCAGLLEHVYTKGSERCDYNLYTLPVIAQAQFAEKLAEHMGCGTEQLSRQALERAHGRTIAEALCSDIPLSSTHTAWHEAYKAMHPSLDAMLEHILKRIEERAPLKPS